MSARRAIAPTPIWQPESDGELMNLPPLNGVEAIRYVLPAREAGEYWGYKISEYHRVCDRISTLTPAELKLVAVRVEQLLSK